MKKVTINLTSEQQDKIRSETGEEVKSFTYEALESRDAPKVGGQAFGAGGANDQAVKRSDAGFQKLD